MGNEVDIQYRWRNRTVAQPTDAYSRILLLEDLRHALFLRRARAAVRLRQAAG